jgi:modification target Cys-rich repeat protein
MKSNMKWRLLAAPFALMILGIPVVACDSLTGAADTICCKDFKIGTDLSAVDWEITGNNAPMFGAFMQATADFAGTATTAAADVGAACQAIAIDLGADPQSVKLTEQATRTAAWCDVAVKQINAVLGENVTVIAQPPSCSFNASVQSRCEAKCTVDETCAAELANVELRCDAGEISGKCRADCNGTCEGSANLAVQCDGICKGTCEGTCEGGSCSNPGQGNECRGSCEGTCKGSCRGSCDIASGAKVTCTGDCTGGCSIAVTAPKCKGELKPPSAKCQGRAECAGSCRASANAKAECTEPSVVVKFSGTSTIDTDLAVASLQLNLPKIVAAARGKITLLAANADELLMTTNLFVSNAKNLSVKAGLCALPAGDALTHAGANLTATVTASAAILSAVKLAP